MPGPITGGGGSSSALYFGPIWTYTAGAMAVGKFKTDGAAPGGTSELSFSDTGKFGDVDWSGFWLNQPLGSRVMMVNTSTGAVVYCASISALTDLVGFVTVQLAGTLLAGGDNWAVADYAVVFSSGTPTQQQVNAASGVPNFSGTGLTSTDVTDGITVNGS